MAEQKVTLLVYAFDPVLGVVLPSPFNHLSLKVGRYEYSFSDRGVSTYTETHTYLGRLMQSIDLETTRRTDAECKLWNAEFEAGGRYEPVSRNCWKHVRDFCAYVEVTLPAGTYGSTRSQPCCH
jgi:hypothetical protein